VDPSQALSLQFISLAGGEARAILKIGEQFRGWPGMAHGGIIGALLTEAMVRAAENLRPGRAALLTFELDFLKPVLLEWELAARGRVLGTEGGMVRAEAELYRQDGSALLAKASGTLAY
jgi:acyl-coenzyme A thioesterase PaaI-like protein